MVGDWSACWRVPNDHRMTLGELWQGYSQGEYAYGSSYSLWPFSRNCMMQLVGRCCCLPHHCLRKQIWHLSVFTRTSWLVMQLIIIIPDICWQCVRQNPLFQA